jgi:CubicO group peptidase (beta-lactamase class C family)
LTLAEAEVVEARSDGIEADLKVTTDTQFQLMSISKSFAATGLALLVDQRRMDWKKPVHEYIPEFRLYDAIASDRVTVGSHYAEPVQGTTT